MRDLSAPRFDGESIEARYASACHVLLWPAAEPGRTIGEQGFPSLHQEEPPIKLAILLEASLRRQPRVFGEERVGDEQRETGKSELDQRPAQNVRNDDERFHTRRPRQVTCRPSMRFIRELANKPKKNKSGIG